MAVFIEITYLRSVGAHRWSFTHSYPADGSECPALLSGRFVSEKQTSAMDRRYHLCRY